MTRGNKRVPWCDPAWSAHQRQSNCGFLNHCNRDILVASCPPLPDACAIRHPNADKQEIEQIGLALLHPVFGKLEPIWRCTWCNLGLNEPTHRSWPEPQPERKPRPQHTQTPGVGPTTGPKPRLRPKPKLRIKLRPRSSRGLGLGLGFGPCLGLGPDLGLSVGHGSPSMCLSIGLGCAQA